MPTPKEGEDRKSFLQRCIPIVIKEGKSQKEAAGQCGGVFDSAKKKEHFVKDKEIHNRIFSKIKEVERLENGDYRFYLETTVPDRTAEVLDDGRKIEGEILDKLVLDKHSSFINDTSELGGKSGAYRTLGLFHDRVHNPEMKGELEEAGFIRSNSLVVPMTGKHEGHWALQVDVGVNDMYEPSALHPDYTPEKIHYKIQNGTIVLSTEYNNTPEQEKIIDVNGELYRYVSDSDIFSGASFARADLVGNTTTVRVKEIQAALKKNRTGEKMAEDQKIKELEIQLEEANLKVKEAEDAKKKIEEDDSLSKEEKKKKLAELEKKEAEVDSKKKELDLKMKEAKLQNDEFAQKIKESLDLAFANVKIKEPVVTNDDDDKRDVKIKEMAKILDSPTDIKVGKSKIKEYDWNTFCELAESKIKEQSEYVKQKMTEGGMRFEQTLKIKCVGKVNHWGRTLQVEPTDKTKELLKTKDVIDATSMAEGTYNQTNAFFADRYVPGITETFLMEDSLMTALVKEPFVGGNDKYQWKIWIDFGTFSGDNTAAVDPNTTSVDRTRRKFIKQETRIVEYRDGVEVTDFTQHHSAAVVSDLLGLEINRAAEFVTNSMDADLFKAKADGTSGWLGFVGMEGVADSTTYSTMYGKSRSAANKTLDSTLTNTFLTTSEPISVEVIRDGYEKVLAQGARLAEIAVIIHPTQVKRLFNSEDAAIRNNILTMAAEPQFGFKRDIVPHIDGIPMIRDYFCVSSGGSSDRFFIADLGNNGFVLIVSQALTVKGLAKVATSEAAYVQFWGAAVYKRLNNIFLHTNLTTP